jgi:hypothetical protein
MRLVKKLKLNHRLPLPVVVGGSDVCPGTLQSTILINVSKINKLDYDRLVVETFPHKAMFPIGCELTCCLIS